MNNILENNQKTDIRYQDGDIVLYEPNIEQVKILKEIIVNENIMEKTDEVSIILIRQVFRLLVKNGDFVDDYSNEELYEKLNNGNLSIKNLLKNIGDILNEISSDMIDEEMNNLQNIQNMVNTFNLSENLEEVKESVNSMLKKSGYNITIDDIIRFKDEEEAIKK